MKTQFGETKPTTDGYYEVHFFTKDDDFLYSVTLGTDLQKAIDYVEREIVDMNDKPIFLPGIPAKGFIEYNMTTTMSIGMIERDI